MSELLPQLVQTPRLLQRYPAYWEPGVDWLGEIPLHWKVRRLKFVAPICEQRAYDSASELPYLALEHIESRTGKLVTRLEPRTPESTTSVFEAGDVLFGKLRPYLAKVLPVDFPGVCSTEFLVLRSNGTIESSNLAHQMLSDAFIHWVNSMTYGAKMPRANPVQIENAIVAIAPVSEQRTIAAFLDRETAKIDGLVAKKEQLIELLQEKRTSLITQAVTKGLDANVPMKSSSVEWLGEIPAHWEVKRNRVLFQEIGERSTSGEEEILTVSHITGVTRRSEKEVTMIEPESHVGYKICQAGHLVTNTMWAWMGALGIASERGIVSPSYNVYRLVSSSLTPEYFDYLCRMPGYVYDVVRHSKGVWKSRLRLYPHEFMDILSLVPPRSEQNAIVEHLRTEAKRTVELESKIHRASECLKEYRAALISAVVTGKIDVRQEGS